MLKQCSKCKIDKPLGDFYKDSHNNDKLTGQCKNCRKEHRKQFYYNSPIYRKNVRTSSLRKKFNITHEEFLEISESQNNLCAICGQPPKKSKNRIFGDFAFLDVDHDHKTGKIRKLLCNSCNKGLGCFRDNVEVLTKAREYLIEHKIL